MRGDFVKHDVAGPRLQGDNTPLHWAAMRGHVEICNLLLQSGADRTIRNKQVHLCLGHMRCTIAATTMLLHEPP